MGGASSPPMTSIRASGGDEIMITMADLTRDVGKTAPKKAKKPNKTEGADRVLVASARSWAPRPTSFASVYVVSGSADMVVEAPHGVRGARAHPLPLTAGEA